MRPRVRVWLAVSIAAIVCALVGASGASAQIAPPWCGTPETDAAENLPDGTDPRGCPPGASRTSPTTPSAARSRSIEAESDGRMTVEVLEDQSAGGRDMYAVTINALDTPRGSSARTRAWSACLRARLAQPAARAAAHRAPRREGAALHPGRDPRQRVRGRGRGRCASSSGWPPPRTAADTPSSTTSSTTRVVVYNPIQDPDGRVAGDAHQRQRLRPQPRLHHSVAAGGPWHSVRLDQAPALHGKGARSARLRHADAGRGDDRAPQPGDRVRHMERSGTSPASTPTRRASRARASASVGRSTTFRRRGSPPARPCLRAGTTGAPSTPASTASCAVWTPRRWTCAKPVGTPRLWDQGRAAAGDRARGRSALAGAGRVLLRWHSPSRTAAS